MGRRSKMTEPRVEALLNALRIGNTRRAACAHADIDPTTFYRWLAGDATFRNAIQKAEGEAEARFLTQVTKAATSWRRGSTPCCKAWASNRQKRGRGPSPR